jgi:hypothetical protein
VGGHAQPGARRHNFALTTQYIEEADQLADTATIIDHGRIITSDTPARLKDELGGERLDITLADPAAIETIPELREKALPVEIRKGTLSFAIPKGESGLKEVTSIMQRLVSEGVSVAPGTRARDRLRPAFRRRPGPVRRRKPGTQPPRRPPARNGSRRTVAAPGTRHRCAAPGLQARSPQMAGYPMAGPGSGQVRRRAAGYARCPQHAAAAKQGRVGTGCSWRGCD